MLVLSLGLKGGRMDPPKCVSPAQGYCAGTDAGELCQQSRVPLVQGCLCLRSLFSDVPLHIRKRRKMLNRKTLSMKKVPTLLCIADLPCVPCFLSCPPATGLPSNIFLLLFSCSWNLWWCLGHFGELYPIFLGFSQVYMAHSCH